MDEIMVIQGRELRSADLKEIRHLIIEHSSWNRTRLSRELAELWNWRRADGRLKDMACRTMLLKLHRGGLIELPQPQSKVCNERRGHNVTDVLHSSDEIVADLSHLQPISLLNVQPRTFEADLFACLLSRYHYLGSNTTVGEHLKYLAVDCQERPLACVLFGSAAWKVQARDQFIGWDHGTRQRNVNLLTNNTRFLLLPWVKIPNLASHLLGAVLRRLQTDWIDRYAHPVHLVETFVDISRFVGTCYKAANWTYLGETTGRSRQDRFHRKSVPVKAIYVYGLSRRYKAELING